MKHSLFLKTLSALALTGGLSMSHHTAYAQEDEPGFQKRWKAQQKSSTLYKTASASPSLSAPTTALRNGPCDMAPNGDFEAQAFVPNRINNLNGGYSSAEDVNGPQGRSDLQQWFSPTAGTPDYYATNATNPLATPSQAQYGPFTALGNGSIGLFARQPHNNLDRVSEYVTSPVALAAGRYYAQFRVNLSQDAEVSNQGITSGFGLQFYTGPVPSTNRGTRDFLPTSSEGGLLSTQLIGPNHVNNWSQAPVSGQFNLPNGATYVTLGLFNASPAALTPLPNRNAAITNTYVFVDDLQIFKIPTAGPNQTCTGSSVQIGEGCSIPGATYAWRRNSETGIYSTSLNILVSPTTTTLYTLTVTLPDGSTYASSTTVVGCPCVLPTAPIISMHQEGCYSTIECRIQNYNPTFTYKVNKIALVNPNPVNPTSPDFIIKTNSGNTSGTFSVSATNACGQTVTTEPITAYFECDVPTDPYSAMTAYPNPATQTITLPSGTDNAALFNDKGKVVQTVNGSRKVDIQSLPEGLYNLQMRQKGKVINQRIEVKH